MSDFADNDMMTKEELEDENIDEQEGFIDVPNAPHEENEDVTLEDDDIDDSAVYVNSVEESKDENSQTAMDEVVKKQREARYNFALSDSDAMRMVETFNNIGTKTYELASVSNVVIKEIKKVIKLLENKNEDISEITDEYYETKKELLLVVKNLEKFFSDKNGIIPNLIELEKTIQNNYLNFSKNLEAMSDIHKKDIADNLKELYKEIAKITDGIDVDEILKNINTNVDKEFKNVNLNTMDKIVKQFKEFSNDMNNIYYLLEGKDGKNGIFYRLSDQLYTANEYLLNFKKKSDYILAIGSFLAGISLAFALTFFYFSQKSENGILTYISKIQIGSDSYNEFLKTTKDNRKSIGFGFFKDTKKPYIFFDKSKHEYFETGDRIYVGVEKRIKN